MQLLFILDLRQIGVVLQTGCKFPSSYTRLHNERWPEEGDALQTGSARITERICIPENYHLSNMKNSPSNELAKFTLQIGDGIF